MMAVIPESHAEGNRNAQGGGLMKRSQPLACVMGDMDLMRPLGLAGIDCAVAVPPGAGARYSRFTRHALDWFSPWEQPEALVEELIRFGETQSERPVLYFQSDAELLLVSRNRKRLGPGIPFRHRRRRSR